MLIGKEGNLKWKEINKEQFEKALPNAKSRMGNYTLSNIFNISYDRKPICLHEDDNLYVAQIVSGRIPDGSKEIPSDCIIKYYKLTNEVL